MIQNGHFINKEVRDQRGFPVVDRALTNGLAEPAHDPDATQPQTVDQPPSSMVIDGTALILAGALARLIFFRTSGTLATVGGRCAKLRV